MGSEGDARFFLHPITPSPHLPIILLFHGGGDYDLARLFILFVNGVLLGLGAAAPIGPVNVEIARRTVRFGAGAGFALGVGAVTIDVGYAIVTGLALAPVLVHPRMLTGLSVAAAIFLGYLAWQCFRAALGGHGIDGSAAQAACDDRERFGARDGAKPQAAEAAEPGQRTPRWAEHYMTGLLLTALNPMTLAFWFVAVPGAVGGLAAHRPGGVRMICAGVFFGAFAWVCFFTAVLGQMKRLGRGRWMAWIDLAGGVVLLAFAVRTIWRLFAPPL